MNTSGATDVHTIASVWAMVSAEAGGADRWKIDGESERKSLMGNYC